MYIPVNTYMYIDVTYTNFQKCLSIMIVGQVCRRAGHLLTWAICLIDWKCKTICEHLVMI